MLAHQVFYLPNQEKNTGTLYLFGGLATMQYYQEKNFKMDLATKKWTQLPDWD